MGKQYHATWRRKKIIGMVYLKHFFYTASSLLNKNHGQKYLKPSFCE